ncbi:MAG: hypothetical protein IIA92_13580 [Chloroflexi bacterium]|nr:hypothetical protein [Chloroflexota bacterium]
MAGVALANVGRRETDGHAPAFQQGQAVVAASSASWVPGVDHVDAFLTYPDEYVGRVEEYFGSRFR